MTIEELESIAFEAINLIQCGDFARFGELFDYALKFERNACNAVKEDLESALVGTVGNFHEASPQVSIRKFEPNRNGLRYLLECDLKMENSTGVLMELIQNSQGAIYLEQISSYRKGLNT